MLLELKSKDKIVIGIINSMCKLSIFILNEYYTSCAHILKRIYTICCVVLFLSGCGLLTVTIFTTLHQVNLGFWILANDTTTITIL